MNEFENNDEKDPELSAPQVPEYQAEESSLVRKPIWRHVFLGVLSLVVIALTLLLSVNYGDALFRGMSRSSVVEHDQGRTLEPSEAPSTVERHPQVTTIERMLPFYSCLAGVLIFVMEIARKKRERWSLREYWGDHLFRVAQSFVYLFIVMWAWAQVGNDDLVRPDVPPNILGFLVGLFILRVERAIAGLGAKFEEVLMAVLPRSVASLSAEERRRQQLRAALRLDEIATQYEAVRTSIENPGARDIFDARLVAAQKVMESDEPEEATPLVQALSRDFETLKAGPKEYLVPLEEVLKARESREVDS